MPSSPEAIYHAIPQAPVAVNPAFFEAEPDRDDDDAVQPVLDARTRQVQFILGCAVLLPWNAMITATPYFISRLANSPLKSAFSSYFSVTFTAVNFLALAHATMTSKQSSPSARIVRSLLCLAALTFALTISTLVPVQPNVFFAFCLLIGMAQASLGSYLQTAAIAIASVFGHAAVQISMSGQAAVAVVVSAVQVSSAVISTWGAAPVSTTMEQAPEERSAFIFFALSTVFLLIAAFAQRWLTRQPSYRSAVKHLEQGLSDHEESRGLASTARTKFPAFDKTRVLRVAKANWLYEVACAGVFVVTLSVFPPITTSIRSTNPRTHPLLFSAIHFLVFACGDLYGRYLCSIPRFMVWSAKRLVTLSLMRTCFVPLFLMCNVQPSSSTVSLPVSPIINSDWLFMLILFLFATSNGYVSSMCMMSASSLDHNPRLHGRRDDVDIAATVAGFSLVGGLALGSMASFVVRGLVCSCNPFYE